MDLTYAQIANKYNRSLSTIKQAWAKHPDWPKPTGRRGRALTFNADQVHDLAATHFLPEPPPEGDPDELLTLAEIAARTGTPLPTLEAYAYRKTDTHHRHWPTRAGHRDGTSLWHWGTVAQHLAARRRKPVNR